jgi:hypothetical protein
MTKIRKNERERIDYLSKRQKQREIVISEVGNAKTEDNETRKEISQLRKID